MELSSIKRWAENMETFNILMRKTQYPSMSVVVDEFPKDVYNTYIEKLVKRGRSYGVDVDVHKAKDDTEAFHAVYKDASDPKIKGILSFVSYAACDESEFACCIPADEDIDVKSAMTYGLFMRDDALEERAPIVVDTVSSALKCIAWNKEKDDVVFNKVLLVCKDKHSERALSHFFRVKGSHVFDFCVESGDDVNKDLVDVFDLIVTDLPNGMTLPPSLFNEGQTVLDLTANLGKDENLHGCLEDFDATCEATGKDGYVTDMAHGLGDLTAVTLFSRLYK
jgi:5,10-methylene-tetrahydrofolate dehydrogenase/methenyl tetrahydrofolate cyclohydrolase